MTASGIIMAISSIFINFFVFLIDHTEFIYKKILVTYWNLLPFATTTALLSAVATMERVRH